MSDVRLDLDPQGFPVSMTSALKAGREMVLEWALREATWEPHDWSAYDREEK